MRWALTLIGEHLEGLEAREVFEGIVGDAVDRLRTRGFHVVFSDFSLDVETDVPVEVPILPESVGPVPEEVLDRWAAEDRAIVAGIEELQAEVVTSGTGYVVSKALLPPLTGASLRAAIRRLKKEIGGNRILSQAEIAEKLGVSRYAIRKALGK